MQSAQPKKLTLNGRTIQNNCILYVLQLQKGKYYVGKSQNKEKLRNRIKAHREGRGPAWTQLHPVVREMTELYEYDRSPFQQDRKVKELMYLFGPDNVRGGTYARTFQLSPEESAFILKEFKGATDRCYQCDQTGHFIQQCPKLKDKKDKIFKSEENKEQPKPQNQDKTTKPKTQQPKTTPKSPENKENKPQQPTKQDKRQQKKYWYLPSCPNCGSCTHYSCNFDKQDQEYRRKYKKRVRCWNCNQYGHYADQCDEDSSDWEVSSYYGSDFEEDFSDDVSVSDISPEQAGQNAGRVIRCYKCGGPHLRPQCPLLRPRSSGNNSNNNSSYKRRPGNCNYCKQPGHWYDECPKRKYQSRSHNDYQDDEGSDSGSGSDSDDNSF